MKIVIAVILLPIVIKIIWIISKTYKHGRFTKEEKEIVQRARYLISKVATSPEQLMDSMPKCIPSQFQGEWAIYSCSMTCKSLANIIKLYPKYKEQFIEYIPKTIKIALSKELREYDSVKFNEDALEGIEGNKSHLSYYSHLAWMIGEYKLVCNDNHYDNIYHRLCDAMNRRIQDSPTLNIPTYPYESIYIPDMLVAIIALDIYNKLYNGKYQETVDSWIKRAKTVWIDKQTGLLTSFLYNDGSCSSEIKGSYSAINTYYLSLIDADFARKQYQCLKKHFKQSFLFTGIKEYHNHKCMFGFDIDAGPIIFNLSPSGTAFAIGCASMLGDFKFRKQLLLTAEIAGSSISWKEKTHYLLANFVLVGETIALAMRTSIIKDENN